MKYGDGLGSLVGVGAKRQKRAGSPWAFQAMRRILDTILRTIGCHLRVLARDAHGLIWMLHLSPWLQCYRCLKRDKPRDGKPLGGHRSRLWGK